VIGGDALKRTLVDIEADQGGHGMHLDTIEGKDQPSMVVRVDLLQGNNIGIKLVQDIDDPIRMYCPSIPTQL
jgi:hypothetical protein